MIRHSLCALRNAPAIAARQPRCWLARAPRATGLALLALAVLSGSSRAADAPAGGKNVPAPLFDGLGEHRHPISTRSKEAQRYFEQGLMLLFNFNHKEAIRSFRAAAALDPQCAMAHWGEAFAYGSHVNAPMSDDAVAPAWAALQEAIKRKDHASPRERAYIDALAQRYAAPGAKQERAALDAAFANAMRAVADAYPDDHDAATFHADGR